MKNTSSTVREISSHPWRPITNRPQVTNLPYEDQGVRNSG
jgi:hypothetical protein